MENFTQYLKKNYNLSIDDINGIEELMRSVGALLYFYENSEEAQKIRAFYEKTKAIAVEGFGQGRIKIFLKDVACVGTGKNKKYLTSDGSLSKNIEDALYMKIEDLRIKIRQLKVQPQFKKLKVDYTT